MAIHKTAIVSAKARLAESAEVGPFAVIGDNVVIGSGTKVGAHCVIEGYTTIGEGCEISSHAVIGCPPQDLKYKGEKSFLEIGDRNTIREFCTFNPGTGEGGKTVIGNGNLFMAYAHVAHDCRVGSDCVIANNGTLAGHVTVEDMVVVGGLAAVHQFVRVGTFSILGGCSKIVQDMPPYSSSDGHPSRIYGLNLIGLRRHGFSKESIADIASAYKSIFFSGTPVQKAARNLEAAGNLSKEVAYLVNFIKNSQRGIARAYRVSRSSSEQAEEINA